MPNYIDQFYYNMTLEENTILGFIEMSDGFAGNVIGSLIVLGFMLVTFLAINYRHPVQYATVTAGLLGTIVAYMVSFLGLLADPLMIYIPLGIFLGSLIAMIYMRLAQG